MQCITARWIGGFAALPIYNQEGHLMNGLLFAHKLRPLEDKIHTTRYRGPIKANIVETQVEQTVILYKPDKIVTQ